MTPGSNSPAIRPTMAVVELVEARSGEKLSRCYQCRKCTNGCPLAFAMDLLPNQVIRMVQLGLHDEVFRSRTIWVCASCQTCTTRCPNDIDIARLMDCLRQMCLERGVAPEQREVAIFHQTFLDSVRRHGRMFELELAGRYKLATRDMFGDVKIGWGMLRRGKLPLLPARIKGRREVRRMFDHGGGG